jgi:murein DD-endopeptidase MepM/ murein hydrolase activator NlpD
MSRYAPGWQASRVRPGISPRIVLLIALVPFLAGVFVAPARPVRGDDLSDAIAQRKAAEQQVASQKAKIAELNAMQASLRSEIKSTSAALKQVNADLAAVKKQITTMTARIKVVQAQYRALLMDLQALHMQLLRLEEDQKLKAELLAQRKEELADRLRDAYDASRTSMLETFLSNESFTDILTEVGYQMDLGEQDKALAEQIVADQKALAAVQTQVDATRAQTDDLRTATAAQKKELDGELADLNTAKKQLASLQAATAKALKAQQLAYRRSQSNEAAARKAMAAAAAAQKRLQAKVDQIIREQAARGNIPSRYNGTLRWPMSGSISQEFGCTGVVWEPPLGSCAHFHKGIDIVAAAGTPVRAAGAGRIVFVGWNPYDPPSDPAWIVIIAHAEDLQTWYAHMQPKKPSGIFSGAAVEAGQIIGYEGNTGNSTGAHLHWGVEQNGIFINPRLFV